MDVTTASQPHIINMTNYFSNLGVLHAFPKKASFKLSVAKLSTAATAKGCLSPQLQFLEL